MLPECVYPPENLKVSSPQKWLILMSFYTRKTFVHLWNTNEFQELSGSYIDSNATTTFKAQNLQVNLNNVYYDFSLNWWLVYLVASLTPHILFCSWGHLEESQNIQKCPHGSSRKSTGVHVAHLQTDIGQRLWKAEWCQHQAPPLQWGFHLPSLSSAVRNHFIRIK